MKESGDLRDQALLQIKKLRSTKFQDLPRKSEVYWLQLDQTLNEPTALRVINKKVVEKDDLTTLEALGIL